MKSAVTKRTVYIDGRKTGISLEDAFWSTLKEIAQVQGATVTETVTEIDRSRQGGNLSAAIRLFVLDRVRTKKVGATAGETPALISAASFGVRGRLLTELCQRSLLRSWLTFIESLECFRRNKKRFRNPVTQLASNGIMQTPSYFWLSLLGFGNAPPRRDHRLNCTAQYFAQSRPSSYRL
jgi:predicted DNA-binding ribbon-helix-helix protein